ncbi:spike base protein, RCAP_Rcc01079 family [Sphingomonas pokkalii]|uniref:Uncharacterized protein n=1 Tax=Sphingomonas pokkalii TaxID=2175090 RepID=A0A2U0SHY9_9SPHN|nr:hypothetical protein [Sphingomonas pokkalii]PVX30971.1 hypothetical protein DD559_17900 [Sphingomonas pokkalii]
MSKVATAELQSQQLDAIAAQGAATDVMAAVAGTPLPRPSRAIRCLGNSGTIRMVMASGQTRDSRIEAGQILPWSILKLEVSGTTATQIEAWL